MCVRADVRAIVCVCVCGQQASIVGHLVPEHSLYTCVYCHEKEHFSLRETTML